jgi:acyl-CoA oxidase
LLDRVCDLHVLSTLEADRAWFVEHGRLTSHRAKGIGALVNALCAELRPFARLLTDAFGIPDRALSAPIAGAEEAPRWRRAVVAAGVSGGGPDRRVSRTSLPMTR